MPYKYTGDLCINICQVDFFSLFTHVQRTNRATLLFFSFAHLKNVTANWLLKSLTPKNSPHSLHCRSTLICPIKWAIKLRQRVNIARRFGARPIFSRAESSGNITTKSYLKTFGVSKILRETKWNHINDDSAHHNHRHKQSNSSNALSHFYGVCVFAIVALFLFEFPPMSSANWITFILLLYNWSFGHDFRLRSKTILFVLVFVRPSITNAKRKKDWSQI